MLFQGQEFASSGPFLFFADHEPELAKLVRGGRRTFLEQFPSVACAGSAEFLSDPESNDTFARCRLDLTERQKHAGIYEMHRDLIRLRRRDPVFSRVTPGGVDGAVLGSQALVLRFFGAEKNDRLLILNFGTNLHFRSLPEPLVAPIEGRAWELKWSSDDPRYGGNGTPCVELNDGWRIPGQAAVVLEPGRVAAPKKSAENLMPS
jgi:maltooligosyltrehalose trehalohydrolase